jgi:hypothetical protein
MERTQSERKQAVTGFGRIHAVEKSFNHGWTQMNTDRKKISAMQTNSPKNEAFRIH